MITRLFFLIIRLAAFWQSLGIPSHSHILPALVAKKKCSALSIQNIPFSANFHLIPLVAWIYGFRICMHIVAGNSNSITQSLHSSCIAGTLGFPVHKCPPCCIGIVILPSLPCINTVAAKVIVGCQYFLLIADSGGDIVAFKALYHPLYLK